MSRLASRTKIKTCDTIIKGTRNVGNRLSGSSRNGAIDCQSFNPNLSAEKATKTMSINPNAFQKSKIARGWRGGEKTRSNPPKRVRCSAINQRRSTIAAQLRMAGTFQQTKSAEAVGIQTVAATTGAET